MQVVDRRGFEDADVEPLLAGLQLQRQKLRVVPAAREQAATLSEYNNQNGQPPAQWTVLWQTVASSWGLRGGFSFEVEYISPGSLPGLVKVLRIKQTHDQKPLTQRQVLAITYSAMEPEIRLLSRLPH